LLENVKNRKSILHVVKKIQRQFQKCFELNEQKIQTSASIGISVCPDDGDDPDNLLRYADQAMYAVKKAGKNGYKFYEKTTPEISGDLNHDDG